MFIVFLIMCDCVVGWIDMMFDIFCLFVLLWLFVEFMYCCLLYCVFCYNLVDFVMYGVEFDIDVWCMVISDVCVFGVV